MATCHHRRHRRNHRSMAVNGGQQRSHVSPRGSATSANPVNGRVKLPCGIPRQLPRQHAIEGDENSKFFHGIINKKRSQLAIRGVLVDGDWIVEPSLVKNEFLKHFATRFAAPSSSKIKRAVWDCGISKSPGPDGSLPPGCNSSFIALIPKSQEAKMVKDFRPISLIGSMYKIITKVLANLLSLVISELISDVQSAFVSNRHILDDPIILNELLSWCKHKKSKALIFKIDFEKAFDSVRWDYLDVVLANFGFGIKWRSWIQGCLNSSMGSILVNAAKSIGCLILHTPFNYLGVKVGGIMSRLSFWDDVIAKLSARLFKWKLKSLSIGGRLTLIKSVLSSLPLYYMSSFKVPKGVLSKMESISKNFFNGVENAEKKMSLIAYMSSFKVPKEEFFSWRL
ncbi:RNA-directed DNA polymerase, eukaryota [Tanacetum coccineum]